MEVKEEKARSGEGLKQKPDVEEMSNKELKDLWQDICEYEDELNRLYDYVGENWIREEHIKSVEETLTVLQEEWEKEMERRGLSWNELAALAEREEEQKR